ncbi:hypothetical protein HDU84_002314 [Entophlyctis sp. JEL0112]|nr:hypothetical protein HDU84_002314 [Entophlyctis sp. JEL0112]
MKRAAPAQQNGRRPRKKAGPRAPTKNAPGVSKAEEFELPSEGRPYTVSIAISASMISQLEKPELRTFLAGQIARCLTIFQVDEVVVYDDATVVAATLPKTTTEGPFESASKKNLDASVFLARILQFCECPPYLRKALFPIHRDLQFASMINLESPHHTRIDDPIPFREGVTLETQRKDGTIVDCGLRNGTPCFIKDKAIKAGVRVTVKLDTHDVVPGASNVSATVISPSFPRESHGIYWGYTVRLASSIGKVFQESPFPGGYDFTFGVSDSAETFLGDLYTRTEKIPPFKHLMVVFGGAKGIEFSIGADESLSVSEEDCASLFTHFVRPLQSQGTRRIKTEENVMITMASDKFRLKAPSAGPMDFGDIDSNDAVASSLEFIVPKTDDPNIPALTIRAIVLGCIFGTILSIVNATWAFRTNSSITQNGAIFAVVAGYPCGLLWHKFVPKHRFWNPAPFSVKEHALICNSTFPFYVTPSQHLTTDLIAHASSTPYGMENVASQVMPDLMGNSSITFFQAFAFIFVTQFTGFGFAGLCRRFLVQPQAILWPSTLSTLALFASFHGTRENDSIDETVIEISVRNALDSEISAKRELFERSEQISSSGFDNGPDSFIVSQSKQQGGSEIMRQTRNSTLKPEDIGHEIVSGSSTHSPTNHTQFNSKNQKHSSISISRQRGFWYSFLGMYLYTFIPEFFFPLLQSVSVCSKAGLASLKAGSLSAFNAVSSSTNGVGFLAMNFDWYYITSMYMTTPFWAILCYAVGNMLFTWVISIALYFSDSNSAAWGLASNLTVDSLNPVLNSVHLFSGNPNSVTHPLGTKVDPGFFYDKGNNYNLNMTAYNDVAPLHITPLFALQYGAAFLTIAAVVSHITLWYGPSIVHQVRRAFKQINELEASNDIHNALMQAYWSPPDWMFLVFLAVMAGLTLAVTQLTAFAMPWWGAVLNLGLTGLLIVPIGIITGASGPLKSFI